MPSSIDCLHCGTPFTPSLGKEEPFCCSGCQFVYNLLHEENLDRYYELKGDSAGTPIQNRPFAPLDLQWLDDLQNATERSTTQAQSSQNVPSVSPTSQASPILKSQILKSSNSLTLQLNGVTCLGCVWLIEKIYLQNPGATRVDIHPQTSQATFYWKIDTFRLSDFATQIQQFGYLLSPPDTRVRPPSLTTRLAICGGLALNTMAFSLPRYVGMEPDFALAPLFDLIALISASLAFFIGGSHFFVRAWHALRLRTLHLDFPISLGLIIAWLGSLIGWLSKHPDLLYFDFVATFTFLMLGGRHLHQLASQRAQSESQQQSPLPESYQTPEETRITTSSLAKNQALLIPPNTPVPVTSILQKKSATCSLAWINGEPDPLTYQPGQRLPAGAINLNAQALHVLTDEHWGNSLTARLTAPSNHTKNSPLLGKIIKIYLGIILLITLGAGIYWFNHAPPTAALQVVISILVISCPCALGTAIPLLDQRGSLVLQRLGIFIQNNAVWEKLPKIKRLLLDKTGTLTLQHPELNQPVLLEKLSPRQREILQHLTATSLHPLSRTLFQELSTRFPNTKKLDSAVTDTPGTGLTTHFDSRHYTLGRAKNGENLSTSCSFSCDGKEIARFDFTESLRPHTIETFQNLKRLESHILSGDNPTSVAKIAQLLQIPPARTHAGLSPDEKAQLAAELSSVPSLYLGDGANDALAFQAATLTATPVSDRSLLEKQADILFASSSLDFLPRLFAAARWRQQTALRIFSFAIAYNLSAIAFCLAGDMTPLLATIIMPASSLVTLAIASRPLTLHKKQARLQKHPPAASLPDQKVVTDAETLAFPKKTRPHDSRI